MFFRKPEKKKRHPFLTIFVAGLCTVGACSISAMVKRKMKNVGNAIKKLCRGKNADSCTVEEEA